VETSLLTTKLNIPPARPHTVPRPRLIERLREGLNYSLVIISAPAGFGKTTLISEFTRQSRPGMPAAWVSLDEGDNDPTRFWRYFIMALQKLHPSCGKSILPVLCSNQPPPVEPLLAVLINELAALPSEFVLVLDDYHFITSHSIHDGVDYLIEHIPVQMHLIVGTRADPPLPLAHFRGKGMMLEIRTDDLRFTQDDTVSLLKELKTTGLSAGDIDALHERTEGWVVGLKMAALSIRGQKDISGFITSFTGSQRYIMDYLLEEVLQKQAEETRDFLLKTSVLERLNAPLCDAVTGRKGSQDILLSLERDHLFIVPLDEERQWYRYEHLFADLLRHQLISVSDPEEINELHRRASRWYVDNDFPDDAIYHALEARDWHLSARFITEHGERKNKRGEFVTLMAWIQRLPEEELYSDLALCKIYCAALMSMRRLDVTESVVNRIEQVGESHDVLLQGYIAGQRCAIARFRGDFSRALELGNQALSVLPRDYGDPRDSVCLILGSIQWERGLLDEAESLLNEAYHEATRRDNQPVVSATLSLLGLLNIEFGRLKQAADYCRHALELASLFLYEVRSHTGLAILGYEWNDLEAAASHNRRAVELAQPGRLVETTAWAYEAITWAYYELAHISKLQGNDAEALELMEKADRSVPDANPLWARQKQVTAHIRFALLQDDRATAAKWGTVPLEEPVYSSLFASHIPTRLFAYIPIRLLIAQGNTTEALEKLQALYTRAAQSGAQYLKIKYRVYQALAAETEDEALEFLTEALTSAELEGYIRTFVDEGKLLKPLLEKALSRGVMPEYTRKLLTTIEAEERQKRKMKKIEGVPSPYKSLLSERELEVLQLMAEGLSNQQIADRLIISLSTTKNHVHNILEKLNVRGRTQAVAQARDLELI
jgi:LuxR family maltose regulon positive regulatory protein